MNDKIKFNGIKESSNYIFHYFLNSVADKEIDLIINEQEKSLSNIINFFNVKPTFKINYYLLNTPEEVGIIYGDNEPCNGFALEPNKVYAVYNDKIKCIGPHEDAHIVSYLVGIPKSAFIRESIAMYFDETWCERKNEDWVYEFIDNHQYLDIEYLLDDNNFYNHSCEITYPIAGAFTRFLVSVLGKDEYLKMYKNDLFIIDDIKHLLKCKNIDYEFKKWIKNNKMD